MASRLLSHAPASPERDRLAAELVAGRPLAVAWSDPAAHAQARPLAATRSGDTIRLSGTRSFVDLATSARDIVVVVDDADGDGLLLSVPADTPGLAAELRAGVDGSAIGALRFDDVVAPSSAVLARAASSADLLRDPVAHARLALAAELAGIAGQAVEMTIAYAKDRVQFGKPIASFQVVQHRLVDMWGDAEFACASVANAVSRMLEDDGREAALAVLAAKARCGDAATSICRRAVHLHGAMGFTDEHDIGLYLKRAIALSATLGIPERMRLDFLDLEQAA